MGPVDSSDPGFVSNAHAIEGARGYQSLQLTWGGVLLILAFVLFTLLVKSLVLLVILISFAFLVGRDVPVGGCQQPDLANMDKRR